ncbi:MAG: hypothetical protein ACREIQ_00955 [Nitrospiria bacterium]
MFFLLDAERLIYHEAWIFLLLFLFALVFQASSRANPGDGIQKRIAFWFAALALDRLLSAGLVLFWLYQPWLLDAWIAVIHVGLFVLEVSIYMTVFYLLNQPIRQKLRTLLRGWLDD